MADEERISIGTWVYPNDLADEIEYMYVVGRVREIDHQRNPIEYRVQFVGGRSDWFDAEELDICATQPTSPALLDPPESPRG